MIITDHKKLFKNRNDAKIATSIFSIWNAKIISNYSNPFEQPSIFEIQSALDRLNIRLT